MQRVRVAAEGMPRQYFQFTHRRGAGDLFIEHGGEPVATGDRIQLVMGPAGPLWYRGYFAEQARAGGFKAAESGAVDLLLEKFKVRRILVGHTGVPTVTPLYEGRVVAVQVYPHRDRETNAPVMEGLLIQNSATEFFAVTQG